MEQPTIAGNAVRWSEELLEMMTRLSAQQRRAIPRIVVTLDLDGGSLRSLLHGDEKICNERTYYRRDRGWHHQPLFRAVLDKARQEFHAALMSRAVDEGADMLREAVPLSVELAKKIVLGVVREDVGDELPPPVARLLSLMDGSGVQDRDKIRAAQVLLNKGLSAALGILDRADIKTAVKQPRQGPADTWGETLHRMRMAGGERRESDGGDDVAEA